MSLKDDIDFRCTCFFNGWWLNCCLEHDYACADANAPKFKDKYEELRLKADLKLKKCVSLSGGKFLKIPSFLISNLMFFGVRFYVFLKRFKNESTTHHL